MKDCINQAIIFKNCASKKDGQISQRTREIPVKMSCDSPADDTVADENFNKMNVHKMTGSYCQELWIFDRKFAGMRKKTKISLVMHKMDVEH